MRNRMYALLVILLMVGCTNPTASDNTTDTTDTTGTDDTTDSGSDDEVDSLAILDSIAEADSIYAAHFYDTLFTTIKSTEKLPLIVDNYEEEQISSEIDANNTNYQKYTFEVNASESWSDISTLGKNDEILYPGALIDGHKLHFENIFSPLRINRNPITLSLALEGTTGSGDLSTVVEEPSLSSVRNGIRTIITENADTDLPVKFEYEETNIYSKKQLGLSLNMPTASSILSNTLGIDWQSEKTKSRRLITFRQTAYSVNMDTPDTLISLDNELNDVNNLLSESIPTYVSGVEYGAALYVVVESEHSSSHLDGILGSIDGSASSPVDDNTSIKVVQYGGNGALASAVQEMIEEGKGLSAVKEYLENTRLNNSLAVPLSYTLRYLADNSIAEIGCTSSYTKTSYIREHQSVRVILDSVEITSTDDGGSWLTPEGDLDNLSTTVKFYQSRNTGDTLVDTYYRSDNEESNSIHTWVKPQKKIDMVFNTFDPSTDQIQLSISASESDFYENDKGSETQYIRFEEWDGSKSINLYVGTDGLKMRYNFTFETL